jgi:hypothetical protein
MRARGRSALTLVALALAVGAGCGGAARLTRSQLLERGDAICRRVAEGRDHVYVNYPQEAGMWRPLIAVERAAFAALEKLVAPAPMAQEWAQLIAIDQRVVAGRTSAVAYASAGRLALAQAEIASLTREEEQAAQLGASDGFAYCSLVET